MVKCAIWRPLAGRESRAVLCADVHQAFTGLEACEGLAAGKGSQRPTQAKHRGCVVFAWEKGNTSKCCSAGHFSLNSEACDAEEHNGFTTGPAQINSAAPKVPGLEMGN